MRRRAKPNYAKFLNLTAESSRRPRRRSRSSAPAPDLSGEALEAEGLPDRQAFVILKVDFPFRKDRGASADLDGVALCEGTDL